MSLRRATLLFAASILIAPPVQAAAAPRWSTPVDLSASDLVQSDPDLAVGSSGRVAAVWRATRAGASSYYLPAPLYVSASGNSNFGSARVLVEANARPVPGSFVPPSDNGPHVAIGRDGSLVLAWIAARDGVVALEASTRTRGGDFTAPIVLDSAVPPIGWPPYGTDITALRVAITPDGTMIVAWTLSKFDAVRGDRGSVRVAVRRPNGSFSRPVSISGDALEVSAPSLAIAPDGTACMAWTRGFERRRANALHAMQASVRPTHGLFSAARNVGPRSSATFSEPRLAAAPDGSFTAAFLLQPNEIGSHGRIVVSRRPAHGSFTRPQTVSGSDDVLAAPFVAAGENGTTSLAWQARNRPDASEYVSTLVHVRTQRRGHRLGRPASVAPAVRKVIQRPAGLAIDRAGRTVVLWDRADVLPGDYGLDRPAHWRLMASTRSPGRRFGTAVVLAPSSAESGGYGEPSTNYGDVVGVRLVATPRGVIALFGTVTGLRTATFR